MDTFNIVHHGDVGVCPLCGGYLKPNYGLNLICVDCGSFFFPIKEGQSEKELRFGVIRGMKNAKTTV